MNNPIAGIHLPYVIIRGMNMTSLQARVAEAMESGYVCMGGVDASGHDYIQAMIYQPKEKRE